MAITAYALSRLMSNRKAAREYTYTPLPAPSDKEGIRIRLITLPIQKPDKKAPDGGEIKCSLTTHLLSEAPDFEAVSYHWGHPREAKAGPVLVDGCTTKVPRSLHDFLLRLCDSTRGERVLWTDSLCINQEDEVEKAAQVAAMRDIYRRAKRMLVWLGREDAVSTRGLEHARDVSRRYRAEEEAKAKGKGRGFWSPWRVKERYAAVWDGRWKAFFEVLERSYFRRAWVVQEILMSADSEVIVVCGKMAIRWWDLLIATIYCAEVQVWLLEYFGSPRGISFALNTVFTASEIKKNTQVPYWEVMSRYRWQLATDPRDKVFAFYGLSCRNSFIEHGIEPAYDVPVERLYANIAVSTLSKASNLDLLSVPRLPPADTDQSLKIPSWSPDWSATEPPCNSLLALDQATLLSSAITHDASKGSVCRPIFNEAASEMTLEGFVVDEIARLSSRWVLQDTSGAQTLANQARVKRQNQRYVYDWEDMLGQNNSKDSYPATGEPMSEVMWQVCVAGTFFGADQKQSVRERWLAYEGRQRYWRALHRLRLSEFLAVWILVVTLGHVLLLLGFQNPEMGFRQLTSVLIGRRAGRTRRGYVGLLPGIAEVGDRVVLFKGGRLPLVLRKRGDKWEFIGDCYIHGPISSGGAWDETKCEAFTLV